MSPSPNEESTPSTISSPPTEENVESPSWVTDEKMSDEPPVPQCLPLHRYTKMHLDPSIPNNHILEAFLTDFPNGEFVSLETSSSCFCCGLFAIQNSLLALHQHNSAVPVPELDDLHRSRVEYAMAEWESFRLEAGTLEPGDEMRNNLFSTDELWLILKGWAVHLKMLDRKVWGGIQLGFVTPAVIGTAVPLTLQLSEEIFEAPANEPSLPTLRVWILHNGVLHWEGTDRVTAETANVPLLKSPIWAPDAFLLPNYVPPSSTGVFQFHGVDAGSQPQQYNQQSPTSNGNVVMGLQAPFGLENLPHQGWPTSPPLIPDQFHWPTTTFAPALQPPQPIEPHFSLALLKNPCWDEDIPIPPDLRASPVSPVIEAANDGTALPPVVSPTIYDLEFGPFPIHLFDEHRLLLLAAAAEGDQQRQPPPPQSQQPEEEEAHMVESSSMTHTRPSTLDPPPPPKRRLTQPDDDPNPDQERRRSQAKARRARNKRRRKRLMKDKKGKKGRKPPTI